MRTQPPAYRLTLRNINMRTHVDGWLDTHQSTWHYVVRGQHGAARGAEEATMVTMLTVGLIAASWVPAMKVARMIAQAVR